MKFGIWFATSPSTVTQNPFNNDLIAANIPGDFTTVKKWRSFADKIDFCCITALNYKDYPGKNATIKNFIAEMQQKKIPVYLSFSCLVRKEGGAYTRLKDCNQLESINWICPADEARITEISENINIFCSNYKPAGILLWYATFPNDYFCYGCTKCLSEGYLELDSEKRSNILINFIKEIANRVKDEHPDVKNSYESQC